MFVSSFQVATGFYLILLLIRNVGYELVEKYSIHASLTYGSVACLCLFVLASILLLIAVPMVSAQVFGQVVSVSMPP